MGKRRTEPTKVAALAELTRVRDMADPLPAAVLAARYAGATLEEIGAVLGITRQSVHGYIRRIEQGGRAA